MKYPDEDFFFTAQSISAFESCPLKFKYRYIEGLRWNEEDKSGKIGTNAGREFHLAARRYFSGIDTGICSGIGDSDIERWVEYLKIYFPLEESAIYKPELKIRLIEGALKLEANIDLLVIKENQAVIWDWKTHLAPGRLKNDFTGSLQTMVYLYVTCRQIKDITGIAGDAAKVSMSYWQPGPEGILCEINPDRDMIRNYGHILTEKIRRIEMYDWEGFNKAQYYKSCKSCDFAGLCLDYREHD